MRQRRGGGNNNASGTNINPVNNNNNENEENNNNEISRNNEAWEVLTDAEFFFVKQRVDWAESFTGIEEANQYTVFDEQNKEQFKIIENKGGCTECLTRQCLKNQRPFTLFVTHKQKRWLRIVRKYSCCLQSVQIYEDDDNTPADVVNDNALLGSVFQKWTFFSRSFYILDKDGTTLLEISTSIFNPYNFVISHNGTDVGEIKKEWSGFGQEIFTDADNFGFNMDKRLSESTKALLLSAVFLIDFMYFEDNAPAQNRGRRNGRGGGFNSYAF